MSKEIKYFKCIICNYILSPIEVNNAKFDMLEYCPRCRSFHPFEKVLQEEHKK